MEKKLFVLHIRRCFVTALCLLYLICVSCQHRAAEKEDSDPGVGQQLVKKGQVTKKKKRTISLLPQASGTPYEMLVIMGEEQWERPMGRALFNVLDTDLPGVAQPERQFRISRIDHSSYGNLYKVFRNIIKVDIQNIYSVAKFKFARDVYARGQMIMTLQAPDEASMEKLLTENGDQLLDFFNKAELNREINFLEDKHNPIAEEHVKKIFGCEVWVPVELNKYKLGKDFFWAGTNKGSKDMNFVMYTYPYTDPNTFTLDYYMHKRDSVMKKNIPGGPEGSYMTTQHEFVDVVDATVKGEYAQKARGLWRVEGDRMGGPFVAQSRVDVANNRVVVVEGFVYAPESLKRNLIRKLEAVLYTLILPNEQNVEDFTYGLEEITIVPGED